MSETFSFESLFAGCQKKPVSRAGIAAPFQSFSRGQLIGLLTATGRWRVVDFSAISGFEDFGIASEAIDSADGAEDRLSVYVEGEFNRSSVIFSYNDTYTDWEAKLADHGIYLRASVSEAGVE